LARARMMPIVRTIRPPAELCVTGVVTPPSSELDDGRLCDL
jgi:hypothetical protein